MSTILLLKLQTIMLGQKSFKMSLYSNEIYEILKKDDYASAVFKDV